MFFFVGGAVCAVFLAVVDLQQSVGSKCCAQTALLASRLTQRDNECWIDWLADCLNPDRCVSLLAELLQCLLCFSICFARSAHFGGFIGGALIAAVVAPRYTH